MYVWVSAADGPTTSSCIENSTRQSYVLFLTASVMVLVLLKRRMRGGWEAADGPQAPEAGVL